MLGALCPALPCCLHVALLCFIPTLPQHLALEEPATGASTAGTAPAPNPLSSQVHQALNQLTHLVDSPGERHQRGGLQKAAARGLEEKRRSKAPAKSCSLFHRKIKCLEHGVCARQQGAPSPWPPTPQLESPLLDEILFRVGEAVKLARSLLRTARPCPWQAGLAGRHPVPPPSPQPGTGNRQQLSPRSAVRHRRHSSSLHAPCVYFPESCKNINNKKFKLKLPASLETTSIPWQYPSPGPRKSLLCILLLLPLPI